MRRTTTLALTVLLAAAGSAAGALWVGPTPAPRERTITITARQYAYDPPVIRVNRGDRITVRLAATDATHGFFLEGYDIDARIVPENPVFVVYHPSDPEAEGAPVQELRFTADRAGKFRYRCSITCGSMHPFMQGELIVAPNRAYPASIGLSIGLVLGMLLYFAGDGRGNGS